MSAVDSWLEGFITRRRDDNGAMMGSYSPLMPKPIRLITSPTHHVAGLSASRLYSWGIMLTRGWTFSSRVWGCVKCVLKSLLILSRSVPSAHSLYSSLTLFCPSFFLIHFFLASFGPPSLASCHCFETVLPCYSCLAMLIA